MELSRQEREQALAAQELLKRHLEEKIRFYKPCSPKHIGFHSSNKPLRFVFGANRTGKSIAGLIELVMRACLAKHPFTGQPNPTNGYYRIATDSFKKAEQHIIPLLKEWVPRKWLRGGSWESAYSDRYHMLHGANGTVIDILTYDQAYGAAESVALDGMWADEEMPESFFAGSLPRLVSRKGRLWLTVTPLHNMTWAMKYWNKTGDQDVDVFKFGFDDNPYLSKEGIATLVANCPEHEKAARLNGEFLEFQGLIYKELDNKVHFIDRDVQPEPYSPVICAVDPHQRKGTFVTWAFVDPHDSVTFFDELHIKGTVDEAIKAIQAKEAGHRARTQLRIIDPAANKQVSGYGADHTTLDEFASKGMGFTLADNSGAGYNVVHEFLQYDKSRPVDSLNRPNCYFTRGAMETWRTMSNLMWDEYKFGRNNRDPKETVKDFEKDFPDCVRYTLAIRPSNHQYREPADLKLQADFYQET